MRGCRFGPTTTCATGAVPASGRAPRSRPTPPRAPAASAAWPRTSESSAQAPVLVPFNEERPRSARDATYMGDLQVVCNRHHGPGFACTPASPGLRRADDTGVPASDPVEQCTRHHQQCARQCRHRCSTCCGSRGSASFEPFPGERSIIRKSVAAAHGFVGMALLVHLLDTEQAIAQCFRPAAQCGQRLRLDHQVRVDEGQPGCANRPRPGCWQRRSRDCPGCRRNARADRGWHGAARCPACHPSSHCRSPGSRPRPAPGAGARGRHRWCWHSGRSRRWRRWQHSSE